MQIFVEECENLFFVVEVLFNEVCVIVGNVFEFDVQVIVFFFESDQLVCFIVFGGFFEVFFGLFIFILNIIFFEEDFVVKIF